jgi:hypothetical protein
MSIFLSPPLHIILVPSPIPAVNARFQQDDFALLVIRQIIVRHNTITHQMLTQFGSPLVIELLLLLLIGPDISDVKMKYPKNADDYDLNTDSKNSHTTV